MSETAETDLTQAANTAFSAKKIADIGVMASYGLVALAAFGGFEPSRVTGVAATLLMLGGPAASAIIGGATAFLTAHRVKATGQETASDNEETKGYRAAFRKAAKGVYVNQGLSVGLMAASSGTLGYLLLDSLVKLIALQESNVSLLGPLFIGTGLAGGYFGLRANAENKRLNASEAAITNQPKAQP